MGIADLGALAASAGQNENQSQANIPLGIVGGAVGALALGVVYGVASLFIGEHSYLAVLIGAAAGFAGMMLGRGTSLVIGIAAAVFTLAGSFVGKLIIGAPEGFTWIEYHFTPFDILFCYVAAPLAAVAIAGGGKVRELRNKLPF